MAVPLRSPGITRLAPLLVALLANQAFAVDLSGRYEMDLIFAPSFSCPLIVRQQGSSLELDPDGASCWPGLWDGVAVGSVNPETGQFAAAGLLCEGLPSTVEGFGDGIDLSISLLCGNLPALLRGSKCGNGLVEVEEDCDDGGDVAGDGCSNRCELETGWVCRGEPSLCSFEPTPLPTPSPTVPPSKKLKKAKKEKKKAKKSKKSATPPGVFPPPGVGERLRQTTALAAACSGPGIDAPNETLSLDLELPVAVTPGEALQIVVEDLRSSFFAPDDPDAEEVSALLLATNLERAFLARSQAGGRASYGPYAFTHVAIGAAGESAVIRLVDFRKELPDSSEIVCEPTDGGVVAEIPIRTRTLETIDQRHDLYLPLQASRIDRVVPVGQEFVPQLEGLDFVDLFSRDREMNRIAAVLLTVNIRRDTIFGPILGSSRRSLPDDFFGASRFEFARVPLTPGDRYVIEVQAQGSGWGIGTHGALGSPLYSEGNFILRGVQTAGDLWFREGILAPRATPTPTPLPTNTRTMPSKKSKKKHKTKARKKQKRLKK